MVYMLISASENIMKTSKKPLVHYFATGGTIDSTLDNTSDEPIPLKHSIIPKMLEIAKLTIPYAFTEVFMLDSRKVKTPERAKLLKALGKSRAKSIVVTFGTYTSVDTARWLQFNGGARVKGKTIVFTASYRPIDGIALSDGVFNLGAATVHAQMLPPGIYISMHGKEFKPNEVLKDLAEGRFDSFFAKGSKK